MCFEGNGVFTWMTSQIGGGEPLARKWVPPPGVEETVLSGKSGLASGTSFISVCRGFERSIGLRPLEFPKITG